MRFADLAIDWENNQHLVSAKKDVATATPDYSPEHIQGKYDGFRRSFEERPAECLCVATVGDDEIVAVPVGELLVEHGWTVGLVEFLMERGALSLLDKKEQRLVRFVRAEVYDGTTSVGHSYGELAGGLLSNLEMGPPGTMTIRAKFGVSSCELFITGGGEGPTDIIVKSVISLSPEQLVYF